MNLSADSSRLVCGVCSKPTQRPTRSFRFADGQSLSTDLRAAATAAVDARQCRAAMGSVIETCRLPPASYWSSTEMKTRCWHAMLVVCVAVLSISTIGRARAHDYRHPELNSWYESLHSGTGACCDGTDAKRVDDVDWDTSEAVVPGKHGLI